MTTGLTSGRGRHRALTAAEEQAARDTKIRSAADRAAADDGSDSPVEPAVGEQLAPSIPLDRPEPRASDVSAVPDSPAPSARTASEPLDPLVPLQSDASPAAPTGSLGRTLPRALFRSARRAADLAPAQPPGLAAAPPALDAAVSPAESAPPALDALASPANTPAPALTALVSPANTPAPADESADVVGALDEEPPISALSADAADAQADAADAEAEDADANADAAAEAGPDPALALDPDAPWIARAIQLATANVASGGGPFGALIVLDGVSLAEGQNRVTASHDPTAHAEVVAIREACIRLGEFALVGSTLYSSCEPCPMCLSAALWARVDRIVYAADRHDAARGGFDDREFYELFSRDRATWPIGIESARPDDAAAPFDAWLAHEHRTDY